MEDKLLHVKGVYNPAEGGFLNKTKNRASTRALELDENALKSMMQDPRYHNPTKQDPAFVKQVEDGFKKLYG